MVERVRFILHVVQILNINRNMPGLQRKAQKAKTIKRISKSTNATYSTERANRRISNTDLSGQSFPFLRAIPPKSYPRRSPLNDTQLSRVRILTQRSLPSASTAN